MILFSGTATIQHNGTTDHCLCTITQGVPEPPEPFAYFGEKLTTLLFQPESPVQPITVRIELVDHPFSAGDIVHITAGIIVCQFRVFSFSRRDRQVTVIGRVIPHLELA